MSTFEESYARLNEEQRKAVETIEGPVMVVAGPGTGKTQVVAVRVANILKKTQMRPGNILCLTFSNSGATAMRERLRSLIGADAYGVGINTIHGFCNEIILQNPHVFETWSALEQISDVERYRAVNRIIDQLLPDLQLVNRKNPYQRTKDILARISQVKREGVTQEQLNKATDTYEAEMSQKSKEGTKAHEKNMLAARKFRDFVKVFEMYQAMLLETQRYDYDDMILNVIRALQEEDWLLASLQERYQYVIVDEFQDTNGAQLKVIDLLTTYANQNAPNICIVGDDDQAIYRFQGANLQNILSFRNRFPTAEVIVLTKSYRCTQPILDAAGRLIKCNTERLVGTIPGLTKDLQSMTGEKGEDPMLIRCSSDAIEPWILADMIEDLLEEGIEPEEIAVLTQTNAELLHYYDALRARELPVQMNGKVNLLRHPLVNQLLCILKAIDQPENSSALAAAISAECSDCSAADIARLFTLHRDSRQSLYSVLLSLDVPDSEASTLPLKNKEALIKSRDTLLGLHQKIKSRTLVQTVEQVLRECNLLPSMDKLPFNPVDFAAIQAFFDRIRYRAYEQTTFSFAVMMNDLSLYEDPEYGDLQMTYAVPHLTEKGVQLMTAHASKGLEYKAVILVNFVDGKWDKKRTPSSLSIPEDILFGWEKDQKTFEQHQDERRVAYVAMTRAKSKLYFLCPMQSVTGERQKELAPSGFFAEASPLPEEIRELKYPEKISTLLLAPAIDLDEEMQAFLRERLKDFSLSVTALNHFLKDPKIFLENDLLQTPQVKSTALVYGNAVHAALRKWGLSVQDGLPLSLEQFIAEFDNYLVDREILTDAERANLLAQGKEDLPRYYNERLKERLPFVHKVEYPLSANFDDIPLKGKIDRIDLENPNSANATVTDFKTGSPKTESEIRGGDYYRQLVFYSLLFEHSHSILKPSAFVLDFIGEGTNYPVERIFHITEQDREELRKLIRLVWKKIQNLDFSPVEGVASDGLE